MNNAKDEERLMQLHQSNPELQHVAPPFGLGPMESTGITIEKTGIERTNQHQTPTRNHPATTGGSSSLQALPFLQPPPPQQPQQQQQQNNAAQQQKLSGYQQQQNHHQQPSSELQPNNSANAHQQSINSSVGLGLRDNLRNNNNGVSPNSLEKHMRQASRLQMQLQQEHNAQLPAMSSYQNPSDSKMFASAAPGDSVFSGGRDRKESVLAQNAHQKGQLGQDLGDLAARAVTENTGSLLNSGTSSIQKDAASPLPPPPMSDLSDNGGGNHYLPLPGFASAPNYVDAGRSGLLTAHEQQQQQQQQQQPPLLLAPPVLQQQQQLDGDPGLIVPSINATTLLSSQTFKSQTHVFGGGVGAGGAGAKPGGKKDAKWLQYFEELKAYIAVHGDTLVPRGFAPNPRLASWVAEQRKQYKLLQDGRQSSITDARVELLKGIHFSWNAQEAAWDRHIRDLRSFQAQYGHCHPPLNHEKYPKLGLWAKEQRRHYALMKQGKPSHMTEERSKLLDQMNFCWDTHEASWLERLRQLGEYKDKHGDCLVPAGWPENPKLSTWVHHQRRQYKKLMAGKPCHISHERVRTLELLGFCWSARKDEEKQEDSNPSTSSEVEEIPPPFQPITQPHSHQDSAKPFVEEAQTHLPPQKRRKIIEAPAMSNNQATCDI